MITFITNMQVSPENAAPFEAALKAHWETDYIRPLLARTTPLVKSQNFDSKRYESR